MPLESCTEGHGASKSSRDQKTVDCSPGKRPEMPEIMSFHDATRVRYRGSRGVEILPDPKTVDYSPRKRPEMNKLPLESCTGGHRASKTSRDTKAMEYSPRKWPEMPEIMNFDDATRVMYRGFTGRRNPPGTQKPWTIAHENGQKCPNYEF